MRKAKGAAKENASTKKRRTAPEEEPAAAVSAPASSAPSTSPHLLDGPEAEAYICEGNKQHLEEGLAVLRTFYKTTSKLYLRWPGTESEPLRYACEVLLADNGTIARKVTHLRIANGLVDPAQGRKLLEAMPHLLSLDLSFCRFEDPKGIAELLAGLDQAPVEKLHLTYSIQAAALPHVMAYVATHKTVQDLDFMGASLGDAGAELIVATLKKRGTPVHNLNLANNELTSAAAASLAELVSLADNLRLANLNLVQNKFTGEVPLAMAQPLAKNKSIRNLWFDLIKIGVRGATAIIDACLSRPGGEKSIDRLGMSRIGLPAAARTKLRARMADPPLDI